MRKNTLKHQDQADGREEVEREDIWTVINFTQNPKNKLNE